MALRVVFLTLLALLTALPTTAQEARVTVPLAGVADLDAAGPDLRAALNAWEAASSGARLADWTRVTAAADRPATLGGATFLMLLPPQAPDGLGTRVQLVDDSGPEQGLAFMGEELVLGGYRILLTRRPAGGQPAEFLLRSREEPPVLLDSRGANRSVTRITGFEDPPRLVVEGPDARAVAFSEAFLTAWSTGASAEDASRAAFAVVPPVEAGTMTSPLGAGGRAADDRYRDPVNTFEVPASAREVLAVNVTLCLVRGDASAVRELSGGFAYDSAGRSTDDPRVRASGDGRGGRVSVGSPGDRLRARVRALEAGGSVSQTSETFVRVPLGGHSAFRFEGPSGWLDGLLHARPRGANQVELYIDQAGGDWRSLGVVNTRVVARDGEVVTLARHTSSVTTSHQSGVPILSGVPYAGPLFGSSGRTSASSSFCLVGAVAFE
jgi:hypothetical protein